MSSMFRLCRRPAFASRRVAARGEESRVPEARSEFM